MNGCKQRTRVRARTVLAVGLSVIMTFGGLPASALAQMQEQAEQAQDSNMPELTGSLPVEEFAATDDGPSNDDLFTGYVQKLVAETLPEGSSDVGEIEAVEQSAAESLEGNDLLAYNKLKPMIEEVAAGRRQSTVFEIPITDLGYNGPWTAAALGVDAIVENGQISNDAMAAASARMEVNASRVVRALLADCPYDLYWFDKTQGNSCGLSGGFGAGGQNGQYVLYCPEGSTWSISFVVSADYAEGGSATTVRSDVLSAVQDAFNNAQSIVNQYANLPAYERLKAYKDEICNRVSYNTAAAQGQVSSKNPWQLIWALDNDPNTTVVCEGYSKAFKYLCDLSGLRNVECLLVSGNMSGGTGAGAHMWNIVNMDDGRNYMVDVTNCDGDVETNNYSVGFPNELFMAYGPAGSVDTTYTFTTKQRPVAEGSSSYLPASSIVYNYDADTRANYPDEALAYADSAYAGPVAQSVSLEDATVTFASEPTYNGEVQKLAPIVILDGETLTKDVDYAVSYEPANPRNAGEVMVTVSGLGDYEGSATGAYTIARKVVTVSADDKAKEYGEADPELTATVEGTLGSDQVAYELSRAAGEEPGEYAIVASGAAEQGNYTVAYQPGTLTIGQVPATQISVPAAASGLVYNGDAQVGVAAGEGYALSGATSATNAGDYIATAILKDGYVWDDGTSEDKSIEWSIARKAVTVSADDKAKAYGEADPELTAMVEGTLGGDQVAYELSRAAGEDAGTYAITATGGAEQGNYAVTFKPGTFTIVKASELVPVAVPTGLAGLVYNGDDQVGVEEGAGYTLGGTTVAMVAGDYIATATLKSGYVWADGSTDAKEISWSIARMPIDLPAVAEGLVYNGARQIGIEKGEGYPGYSLVGVVGAMDAGTYDATVTPDKNHCWKDGTYETKQLVWYIAPKPINVPTANAGLVYNGEEQVGVETGEGYLCDYPSAATKVGSYETPVSLLDNYCWSDGSTEDKSIAWSIAPKSVTVRADDKTKAYGEDDPELTATVTGLVGDDEVAFVLAREAGEDVGAYAITPTGDVGQGNYTVTYQPGTLTIEEAPATQIAIPVAASGLVYDGTEQVGVEPGEGYTLSGAASATDAGDYLVTATLKDGYVWDDGTTEAKEIAWSIARKAVTVRADDKSKVYGDADPDLTATVTGTLADDVVEYALSREAGNNVGTYAITAAGDAEQGNYAVAFKSGTLTIARAVIAVPKATNCTYNGKAQTGVTVGTGYSLSGTTSATNAGTYKPTATPDGNHCWADGTYAAKTIQWSIAPLSVANATVASVAMQLYTGSAITPKPKITYSGATLKEGTDYALAYKNNVNLGTATITITGKGNFTGSRSVTFKIAKSVAKLTVTAPKAQTYTGKALTPKPTVKDGSKTLVLGTDYTLAYKNNVNAGTATVTITGKGNYTGTRSVTFTIAKKASTISLAAQTKTYNGKVLAYSGKVTKTGSTGKVTYKYYSDAKCTKAVAATSVKATKTYYVKGTLAADANHTGKTSDAAKFIIAKATQPMTATAANKTASFATLKTKAVTVARPITISKAQGTLSYAKVASGSSAALTVNKTIGKVTVKKGTKKGTYTIKIKVAAAGNANYKAGSKNVTCKVVVK